MKKTTSAKPKEKAVAANRGRTVPGKLTPEVLSGILDMYANGKCCLLDACHAHHVSLSAFNRYRSLNPDFENGPYAEAHERSTQALEALGHKLALQANEKSCTMLIFMLKARKPSVYRDSVNVTGSVGVDFAAAFATAMTRVSDGRTAAAH